MVILRVVASVASVASLAASASAVADVVVVYLGFELCSIVVLELPVEDLRVSTMQQGRRHVLRVERG